MATFLFDQIIFGPVNSRRLGVSLGINLLPTDNKVCNFNCIYCECGWNTNEKISKLPSRQIVKDTLNDKLKQMNNEGALPDVITFAGNGEPTVHPDFEGIIKDTIKLRNTLCPSAKVAVLTNATMLHSDSVVSALKSIDRAMLKLDSAFESTQKIVNQAQKFVPLDKLLDQFRKFEDNLIIQTLFLKAEHNGQMINNTTEEEINALLDIYKQLKPKEVMVYCVARDTPLDTVYKIEKDTMDSIADRIRNLGIEVSVSY